MDPVHSAGSVVWLVFWVFALVCLVVFFVEDFRCLNLLCTFLVSFLLLYIGNCDSPVAHAGRAKKSSRKCACHLTPDYSLSSCKPHNSRYKDWSLDVFTLDLAFLGAWDLRFRCLFVARLALIRCLIVVCLPREAPSPLGGGVWEKYKHPRKKPKKLHYLAYVQAAAI